MTAESRRAAERRGKWSERIARTYLILTGWRILEHRARGARGSGAGEIDLIARRGQVLAFVEVKGRNTVEAALDAVSAQQRIRIARGAEAYLSLNPDLANCDIRFDVIAVRPWRWPVHLKDAWRLS